MTLSVYHSVHGPHPNVLIRKRNTLQNRFGPAERTRKIYLTKSVRTHFLSGFQVYYANWCRVPTALNKFHFDLILKSVNTKYIHMQSYRHVRMIKLMTSFS